MARAAELWSAGRQGGWRVRRLALALTAGLVSWGLLGCGETDRVRGGIREGVVEAGFWDELARRWSGELQRVERDLISVRAQLEGLPAAPETFDPGMCLGYHSEFSKGAEVQRLFSLGLAQKERIGWVVLVPSMLPGMRPNQPSYGFPKRFRIEVGDDRTLEGGQVVADYTESDFPDPLGLPVVIPLGGVEAQWLGLRVTRLNGNEQRYFYALSEWLVFGESGRCLSVGNYPGRLFPGDSFGSKPTWRKQNVVDGMTGLGAPVSRVGTSLGHGWQSVPAAKDHEERLTFDLGEARAVEEIRLHPAHPVSTPRGVSFAFPKGFRIEGESVEGSVEVLFRSESGDFPIPGNDPVCIRLPGKTVRRVRVVCERLREVRDRWTCAFSEVEVLAGGKNVALGVPVEVSSSLEEPGWGTVGLTDGFNSEGQLTEWLPWLEGLSRRRELEREQRDGVQRAGELRRIFGVRMQVGLVALALLSVAAGWGAWWRSRRQVRREIQALRGRIARDLHDEIGSNLGTIAMLSQMSLEGEGDEGQREQDLREIGLVAHQSVESIRDLVWLLNRESTRREDFVAELREAAQTLLAGCVLEWRVEMERLPQTIPFEVRRNLFLAFKEILHNAAKHARASRVGIRLEGGRSELRVEVRDDGVGFDLERVQRGVGLGSLEARAKGAGGGVEVVTAFDRGTTVRFWLPVRRDSDSMFSLRTYFP